MLSQRTVAGKGLAPSGRSVQPIRARGLQRARVSLNPVALFGALRQRLGQSTTQTQPREIIRRVDGVELMDWMVRGTLCAEADALRLKKAQARHLASAAPVDKTLCYCFRRTSTAEATSASSITSS